MKLALIILPAIVLGGIFDDIGRVFNEAVQDVKKTGQNLNEKYENSGVFKGKKTEKKDKDGKVVPIKATAEPESEVSKKDVTVNDEAEVANEGEENIPRRRVTAPMGPMAR